MLLVYLLVAIGIVSVAFLVSGVLDRAKIISKQGDVDSVHDEILDNEHKIMRQMDNLTKNK